MQRNVEYPSESQQKKAFDKYVMVIIARDLQPFSMIDDNGFRDRMPSRTYFRDLSYTMNWERILNVSSMVSIMKQLPRMDGLPVQMMPKSQ